MNFTILHKPISSHDLCLAFYILEVLIDYNWIQAQLGFDTFGAGTHVIPSCLLGL